MRFARDLRPTSSSWGEYITTSYTPPTRKQKTFVLKSEAWEGNSQNGWENIVIGEMPDQNKTHGIGEIIYWEGCRKREKKRRKQNGSE